MLVPLKEEDRCNTLDLSRLSHQLECKKCDCGFQLKTIHVIVGVERGGGLFRTPLSDTRENMASQNNSQLTTVSLLK